MDSSKYINLFPLDALHSVTTHGTRQKDDRRHAELMTSGDRTAG